MWIIKWIFMAILILFVIGFAMQNTAQIVSISFFNYRSQELPVWMLMYISFGVGVLFWLIVTMLQNTAGRAEKLLLEKELAKVRQELDRLRNLSVEESIAALGIITSASQKSEG